jgi:esterase/lipase superfamily enzyme
MLFITNRFPTQSIRTRVGRSFSFDLANNAPSNSIFFCERADEGTLTEIGSLPFMHRLRECDCRQILLYIHGFGNLPEDVFDQVAELQRLCDRERRKEVMVVPMIWPCDNDLGVVQDYWDDQKSADQSAFAFSRALEKFLAWRNSADNPEDDPCLKRVNVLAHSMGNRVLRGTLQAWNRYDLPRGIPLLFRNTYMVAADVVNETLQYGEPGELICHASRNVVVYHASDDLALRSSKAANLKNKVASRRLGHSGPEDMQLTPRNVYSVDCDDVNNAYDPPFGHSYFRRGGRRGQPGKVFEHIFACLLSGRVFPDDEHQRTTVIRTA